MKLGEEDLAGGEPGKYEKLWFAASECRGW